MTKLLDRAFNIASELPDTDQDAIATAVLNEIADRQSLKQIQEFSDVEVLDFMERQAALFGQMKGELLKEFEGLFILFENGQVLDADTDESALFLRNYSDLKSIFIKKVVEVEPPLSIRGFLPQVIV